MSYKLIDIDEMNIEYTFSASELLGVTFIEMINLHLRGGYNSTYHLPLTGMPIGQTITIYNKDFGFSATGRYTGVKMVLSLDINNPYSIYTFCFTQQVESFMFDGTSWLVNRPKLLPIPLLSFIERDIMQSGYVDINDINDPQKSILFSNLDISNFNPSLLEGKFFREGYIRDVQKGGVKKHTHNSLPHSHNFLNIDSQAKTTKRADTTGKGSDMKDVIDSQSSNKESTLININLNTYGELETAPTHVIGRYVIKCY